MEDHTNILKPICPGCKEPIEDGVVLPCGTWYCRIHLQDLINSAKERNKTSIVCDLCNKLHYYVDSTDEFMCEDPNKVILECGHALDKEVFESYKLVNDKDQIPYCSVCTTTVNIDDVLAIKCDETCLCDKKHKSLDLCTQLAFLDAEHKLRSKETELAVIEAEVKQHTADGTSKLNEFYDDCIKQIEAKRAEYIATSMKPLSTIGAILHTNRTRLEIHKAHLNNAKFTKTLTKQKPQLTDLIATFFEDAKKIDSDIVMDTVRSFEFEFKAPTYTIPSYQVDAIDTRNVVSTNVVNKRHGDIFKKRLATGITLYSYPTIGILIHTLHISDYHIVYQRVDGKACKINMRDHYQYECCKADMVLYDDVTGTCILQIQKKKGSDDTDLYEIEYFKYFEKEYNQNSLIGCLANIDCTMIVVFFKTYLKIYYNTGNTRRVPFESVRNLTPTTQIIKTKDNRLRFLSQTLETIEVLLVDGTILKNNIAVRCNIPYLDGNLRFEHDRNSIFYFGDNNSNLIIVPTANQINTGIASVVVSRLGHIVILNAQENTMQCYLNEE
jgi:hypothetical protein